MKLLIALVALLIGNPSAYAQAGPHVGVPTVAKPAFVFRFDRPPDVVRGEQRYRAGGALGAVGEVLTANRGAITRVRGVAGGGALRFPARCSSSRCPRAIVEVPHDPRLNPRGRSFSFGAAVLLQPDETTRGSNVMQKGRYRTSGGQWKLQVDGLDGRPSCVFRDAPGRRGRVAVVSSPVTVATGEWHRVRCVRTANRAQVVVDGRKTSVPASLRALANTGPVQLGGPGLGAGDDQFHGRLDDVFLRISRG